MASTKLYILVLIVALFGTSPAFAATQGTLGTTSQGVANISITKSVQAQISGITDMVYGNWSIGGGDVTMYSDVCIYSSTGSYKVTATGSGALGLFTLSSNANALAYSVVWNDGGAGGLASTGTTLLPTIQSLNTFTHAATASATCGGVAANYTARVVVNISELALNLAASSATAYTGTLTLLITPI